MERINSSARYRKVCLYFTDSSRDLRPKTICDLYNVKQTMTTPATTTVAIRRRPRSSRMNIELVFRVEGYGMHIFGRVECNVCVLHDRQIGSECEINPYIETFKLQTQNNVIVDNTFLWIWPIRSGWATKRNIYRFTCWLALSAYLRNVLYGCEDVVLCCHVCGRLLIADETRNSMATVYSPLLPIWHF